MGHASITSAAPNIDNGNSSTVPGVGQYLPEGNFVLWREEPGEPGKKPRKVPVHPDGRRHCASAPQPLLSLTAAAAHPGCRVGYRIPTGSGIVCLDLDNCVLPDGTETAAAALARTALAGAIVERSVSGNGLHFWFIANGRTNTGTKAHPLLGDFDLFADDQKFIALGRWESGTGPLPDRGMLLAVLVPQGGPQDARQAVQPGDWHAKTETQQAECLSDLRSALAHAYNPDSRDDWVSAGQALAGLGEDGRAIWEWWSATSTAYPGGSDLERWETFSGDRSDYRSIFARAGRAGWKQPKRTPDPAAVFSAGVFAPPAGAGSAAGFAHLPQDPRGNDLEHIGLFLALLHDKGAVRIHLDVFRQGLVIAFDGEPLRPVEDTDTTRLVTCVAPLGLRGVKRADMRAVMELHAKGHQIDTHRYRVQGLQWDGVPRVDGFMCRAFGTEDADYARAVGRYLWSALAGRAVDPGTQADMVPVLVGGQGLGKTSAVRAIASDWRYFAEIDLAQRGGDQSRHVRGKVVGELAELKGINGRDQESIKAFITQREEVWTPKYSNDEVVYPRRLVFIGTTNHAEFLDDETGARRWLPVNCCRADAAYVQEVRDQLWAEGLAIYRAGGVAWQGAQKLAEARHGAFRVSDPWEPLIVAWLASVPPHVPGTVQELRPRDQHPHGIALHELAAQCLGVGADRLDRRAELRIAKVLRAAGWEKRKVRIGQGTPWRWLPAGRA